MILYKIGCSQHTLVDHQNIDSILIYEGHYHSITSHKDRFTRLDEYFGSCMEGIDSCSERAYYNAYFDDANLSFGSIQKLLSNLNLYDTLYEHGKINGHRSHNSIWLETSAPSEYTVKGIFLLEDVREAYYMTFRLSVLGDTLLSKAFGLFSFDKGNMTTFFTRIDSMNYIRYDCNGNHEVVFGEDRIEIVSKSQSNERKNLRLFDSLGKRVSIKQNSFYSSSINIELPDLSSGLYFLSIEEKGCSSTVKFIIP